MWSFGSLVGPSAVVSPGVVYVVVCSSHPVVQLASRSPLRIAHRKSWHLPWNLATELPPAAYFMFSHPKLFDQQEVGLKLS